ncbi:MAG: three-Cys-motif partner protein TcmP [Desulfurococcales archaeon]|nr:three-Cys-motif partner protein TcmP [Desulfurococcales archaeon]
MPGKRRKTKKQRDYQKDFERFKTYIHKLREEAIQLVDSLPPNDKKIVLAFFSRYYREEKEHYWSITKLFAHAMYIPMFLQIGRANFDRLIYIDTHSGPGLARIGPADDEIVLGSPLIALRWPEIIAQNVRQYRKIASGFDAFYFIELDPQRAAVLNRLVDKHPHGGKAQVRIGNSNTILPSIIKKELQQGTKPLFYIFIDPYGEINTQLTADTILASLKQARADVIITVFDAHIARAFSGKPNPDLAGKLFGREFCQTSMQASERLCRTGNPRRSDIIKAFKYLFNLLGYKNISIIPVMKENITIYHLMLAVKHPSSPWVKSYINYLKRMLPKPEILKNIWKNITGRQTTLDNFF